MKKNILLVIILSLTILLSACSDTPKPPYTLKFGAYGLKQVTITNILTKEVIVKSFDELIADNIEFDKWSNLLNFTVGINNNTEYVYKKDNRCFVLNEGLAFEVVEENTLKLHFPYWTNNDHNSYDIVILLGWQQRYG